MSAQKLYEFKLSRIQVLVSLLTLTGCVALAFTLGVFTGRRLFHNPDSFPPVPSTRQAPLPDKAVSDYGTFQPLDTAVFDSGKTASEFSFYDTLPRKAESPSAQKPEQAKTKTAPPPSSTKNAAVDQLPATSPGATAYTIQMAAFRQKEKAYALADNLTKRGYHTQVTGSTDDKGESWYRVRVGRFEKPEEAQYLLPALSEVSPAPRIVPVEE